MKMQRTQSGPKQLQKRNAELGTPSQSSGWDLAMSLLGPKFISWWENQDPARCVVLPKRRREKEDRVGELTLPDFKTYYKTTGIQKPEPIPMSTNGWDWIKQRWHTHTTENYTVTKRNSY